MKYLLFGFLFVGSLSAKTQQISDSILIEQHYRTFTYHKPIGNTNEGSLVFIMHGSGGNGKNMLKHTTKLEAITAKENLLIVYPDAYKNYWNECRKYSTAAANKENVNEQAFFTGMIQYFHTRFNISTKKVYAAGFSGGGHMAYKLALTMPNQVKAIAALVANMPDSASCDCKLAGKPKPVLIINGTDDKTNPYNGGEMFVNNASFGVVLSTENTFNYWAALAGHTGTPTKKILPDTDPNDQKTVECYTYRERKKPTVTLLKVVGGRHDYPNDIDVYLYAWEFFKSVK